MENEVIAIALTSREWLVLSTLASTGENECPWAWSNDWPQDVDSDEALAILVKFRMLIRVAT